MTGTFIRKALDFRHAVILAAAILTGHLALVAIVEDASLRVIIVDLLLPVEGALAVAALAYAAHRSASHSRRLRDAWGILVLAYVAWTLGDVVWAIIEIVLRQDPFPSVADGLYLSFYPLFLIGVLRLPATRLTRREGLAMLLDISIVLLSAALVSWNFLIGPLAMTRATDLWTLVFSLAYPLFDLVLLGALLVLLFRPFETQRRMPLFLLAGAATTLIVTDTIFGYQSIAETYVSGSWVDAGWMIGFLFAALAGVAQAEEPIAPASADALPRLNTWSLYLPYGWLTLAYGLLGWSHDHALPMGFFALALGVGAVIALALVRQTLALRENARLHEQVRGELLERARAEASLRAQKELFENLVTLARATVEQPTLEATLQNALQTAAALTGAEYGDLILLDPAGAPTHSLVLRADKTSQFDQGVIAARVLDKGLAGWVARQRQAALLADTERDERWLHMPEIAPPIRSALCVPIVSGATLAGVLTLVHSQPGHFDAEHLRLMQTAADQMALAMRNAQNFDAQQRAATRQATLYRVLSAVSQQLDPVKVTQSAVETIAALTGWAHVNIALPDAERAHWIIQGAGGALAPLEGMTRPIGAGIIGRVFRTGVTQCVADVLTDPDYIAAHPAIRSELATPLRRGGSIIGVLNIESDHPGAFGAEEAQLAESLADAVALALDNARLYEETERLGAFNENIVQSMEEGILIEDATGTITFVNPRTEALLGYAPGELIGRHWSTIVAPEMIARVEEEVGQRPQGVASRYETVLLTKRGARVPVIVGARPAFRSGRFNGVLSVFTDITERKQAEERLVYLSTHDVLTGLYNRAYFEEELARLERGRQFPVSILMADADRMKEVNDTLGHAAGDELLRHAARVLQSAFRGEDLVARIGGDEFAVLLPNANALVAADALARLRERVEAHNRENPSHALSFSLGVATGERDIPLAEVLKEADRRMYRDKFAKSAR